MQIDPRLVSTPIGAALGVLIARRVLGKKDYSLKNMLIGGGIGGGAGYLAGQFIKGDPGDISTPRGYMRWIRRQKPEGMPSKKEISALNGMHPMYGGIDADKAGFLGLNKYRRKAIEPAAGEHEAAQVYKARALAGRKWAGAPGISESARGVLSAYADKMDRNYEEMAGRRTDLMFGPIDGMSALVRTLFGD